MRRIALPFVSIEIGERTHSHQGNWLNTDHVVLIQPGPNGGSNVRIVGSDEPIGILTSPDELKRQIDKASA